MNNRTLRFVVGLGMVFALAGAVASAQTTLYTDRATFEGALGATVVDPFTAAPYGIGDISNGGTLDIHSNAHMSGVIGETDYASTGFNNWNFIVGFPTPATVYYCAGCNGSFLMSFLTTSVGTANGVFGAGFDIRHNSTPNYHAYITFGDSTTQDVALPGGAGFFGVTSSLDIESIHLGLAGGGNTTSGSFGMRNPTIGAVPEPAALSLLSVGALMLLRRRR